MLDGLLVAIGPMTLFWTLIGVAGGVFVGAVPGLGGGMLMALCLPLTFGMVPHDAILLLIGIHVGSVSGGLISATLLRMPGTPSSLMTTFDGYPMAQRGEAVRALGLGIGASLIGGLLAGVVLATLSPPLSIWALGFGPWELAALILMALVLVAAIAQGSMIAGLVSAALGVAAALPGIVDSDGMVRLTFGNDAMTTGFRLLPVLLGVFVISQLFKEAESALAKGALVAIDPKSRFPSLRDWRNSWFNLLRSSVIGTFIGILPGVGASISSMVAYGVARSSSRTPEKFGTGHDEGIVASEAGNNANVGGALVPLITLGIPGAPVDAILLGAMIIHHIQPGPLLFVTNSSLVWAMIAGYFIANIMMFIVMAGTYRQLAQVVLIPKFLLVPVVLVFCIIGSYSVGGQMFDVWVMLGFGLLGYFMEKMRVPLGPFVIGYVLAPMLERELRTALQLSDSSFLPLLERPAALLFCTIAIVMLVLPFIRRGRTSPA
jgi:putative tricarboxylic transport membrane protein